MTKGIIRVDDDAGELSLEDRARRDDHYRRFEEEAQQAIVDGQPPNTVRAYLNDMGKFTTWCKSHRPVLPALPTNEATLLGYLKHLDRKVGDGYAYRSGTIERSLSGIVWAHAVMNISSPMTPRSSKMLHAIKVRRSAEGEAPRRAAAPLTVRDLHQIIKANGSTPFAVRNRALLLLGWNCAMRRSEIAALQRRDIGQISDEGFVLTIRRSKADQLGAGADLSVTTEGGRLCPVGAMREWLELRGHEAGPLFSRLRGQARLERALTDKQVARIVMDLVATAGVKPENRDLDFSAHSLRAGFITEAIHNGVPEHEVMRRSRHKSHETFLGYVRIAQTVKKNAAKGFSKWGDDAKE